METIFGCRISVIFLGIPIVCGWRVNDGWFDRSMNRPLPSTVGYIPTPTDHRAGIHKRAALTQLRHKTLPPNTFDAKGISWEAQM